MRSFAFILMLGLVMQTVAIAQISASAAKPDLSSMSYFLGSWSCKRTKNPDKKLIGTTRQYTITTAPNGNWDVVTSKDGTTYFTQDAKTKQWFSEYVGSDGSYGTAESSGWNGNSVAFKDTLNSGGNPLGTSTFTKMSPTQYTASYVAPGPQGAQTYESLCSKS